ncbi:hypothetical protein C8J57DRAFT_1239592 [Mycena rebaudengoi]|nr:hypothetical protein C8J57DRAFT_1239592 [Mycena rebaudengoi]
MKEPRALGSDARPVVFRIWTGSTYFGPACGIGQHRHLKGGFERLFIAILAERMREDERKILKGGATLPRNPTHGKFGRSAQPEGKEKKAKEEEEERTFCPRIPFHAKGRLGICTDNGGTQVTAEGLRSVCDGVALVIAAQMVVVTGAMCTLEKSTRLDKPLSLLWLQPQHRLLIASYFLCFPPGRPIRTTPAPTPGPRRTADKSHQEKPHLAPKLYSAMIAIQGLICNSPASRPEITAFLIHFATAKTKAESFNVRDT